MRIQTESLKQKIVFKNEEGIEIAYCSGGRISAMDGRRVAILEGGNVYTADRQLLGRLTPSGVVRRHDGAASEGFLKLVGR
jgi:hypothetical protein